MRASEAVKGDSAEEYHRLLAREPDSLRFAEYADHLRRLGLLSDASTICRHGLERHPGYASGHIVMGEILRDAGQLVEAEAEWRKALSADPTHPRAHMLLGELFLVRAETERAVAAFETALVCNAGCAEAQARLAQLRGPQPSAGSAAAARHGRRPSERPGWLTSDRFEWLTQVIGARPGVESAALAEANSTVLAGRIALRAGPLPAKVAVSFLAEARDLLSRLGAGRVRSALIASDALSLCYVPLGELVLLAALLPGAGLAEVSEQIEQALANGAGVEEPADADT